MRKPIPMPDLPPGLLVVGPDDPCLGYLQLVRPGAVRTLCDLPVQPHWSDRAPEDWRRFLPCLGCLQALARGEGLAVLDPAFEALDVLTVPGVVLAQTDVLQDALLQECLEEGGEDVV